MQESQWHGSQKLTKERDGSLLAEFCLDDTAEIKPWIMSFGASAVVLEPAGLRREIVAELESLLAAYRRVSRSRNVLVTLRRDENHA